MRRRKRVRIWAAALTALMVFGTAATAWADDTEKIDKVSLKFSYESDAEPETGDEVGTIHVTTDSKEFYVDYAEYTNDTDIWTVGDVPEVRVELIAEDGYRFSYRSESHFSLSGCNADFKKASIQDDGSYMEVTVELKRIGGKLEGAENLEWSGRTAVWDELEGAKSYEVKLYRDERLVDTVETASTSYNFSGYMTEEGDYSFRVRAIANYNDRAGEWSEYSDDYYVDEDEVSNSPGSGWRQDTAGWWYVRSNGTYPVSCWEQINGAWYRFNSSGYMLTGWQYIDNAWYYLNSSGAMLTGWQYINGAWYYLNPSGVMLTGWQNINGAWYCLNPSGVMLTGWQAINGKWYYMDGNGVMYANRMTPDGHYVDGSGAMVY